MSLRKTIKELSILAKPIIMGQVGMMLIGAGDVLIASMYSTKSVAAIGVANGLINPLFIFGLGLAMGISPSLAVKRGAGTNKDTELSSAIVYGLLVGLAMTFLTLFLNQFVPHFGIDEQLVPSIMKYNNIVAWSFPFATMFQAMKEYLQSKEEVFFPNLLAIIAVGLNLGLNYVLVFGASNIGGIGEVGLAYASLAIRFLLSLFLLLYLVRREVFTSIDLNFCKMTFKFSLPIATMFLFEVSAFCLVGVLGGLISVTAAATNNIAMTLASVAFMVPLSISHASSVKVGNAYGRQDLTAIYNNIKAALIIGLGFVGLSSICFFVFPKELMSLVSDNQDVIKLGTTILIIAGVFQLADSLQVILNGLLRGIKQVKIPSIFVFIGFWLIGIPIGVYLSFYENYGLAGLWIGLAIALAAASIGLGLFLKLQLNKLKINGIPAEQES